MGSVFVQSVRHYWPELSRWLEDLPDSRFEPFVVYDRRLLGWWGVLLFVLKLGSRRQLNFDLRDGDRVLENVNRLAETDQKTLPVDKTLDHFLAHSDPAAFAALRRKMIRRLIRMKALDFCRLPTGHFVVAIDGTGHLRFHSHHCPQCLTQQHGSTTVYTHQVFEAKLVSASGLALSISTEFIENPSDRDETATSRAQAKQDCELKALARLAPALKRDFPQTPICLTGDSLHACGTAMHVARSNSWAFVFTFKCGRLPALWQEFQALLKLSPSNVLRIAHPNGARRVYRWINGLPYTDSEGRNFDLSALQCKETRDGKTTTFAWVTDLKITPKNVDAIACNGGRIRSKIENQGFNIQKNSDLNLRHAYSTSNDRAKAYYYLLQIAHIILQMLEMGSLLERLAQRYASTPIKLFGSLKNIARRLLECLRNYVLPDHVFDLATAIRIRLDTS